jgi:hypothetical protein
MVLKTVGRKTGKTRFMPVNYAIQKAIYSERENHARAPSPAARPVEKQAVSK